jgi:hypothetical protein
MELDRAGDIIEIGGSLIHADLWQRMKILSLIANSLIYNQPVKM